MSGEDTGTTLHLYDSLTEQKRTTVEDLKAHRDSLKRTVAGQRMAAMPDDMRRAALGPSGQISLEIVEALRAIIAVEVTRQLDLAVRAMMERATPPAGKSPDDS